MQIQKIVLAILLAPLLAMLSGCQPGESTQQSQAPTPATPATQQAADNATKWAVSEEAFTKLAKDTGCFACHSIKKKLLGPAWKNVATLYRTDPAGEEKLMSKIANGGSGIWGNIDMPAYPTLSEEDRRVLTQYILSLK
ncbi:MAG: c-type cytochrome [Sulfuricella sp.]|nr:c-type cytochrome [Sulfuricella sp.]